MNIIEIKGNLFTEENLANKEICLVHCISRDCEMGLGIAKTFKEKFSNMKQTLLKMLKEEKYKNSKSILYENKVFNLITKEKYWQKPTYSSLKNSLLELKEQCLKNNIKILAMPRIACGLDKLEWTKVKMLLNDVFSETEITIYIYKL